MPFLPAHPHRLFTGAPSGEASRVPTPAGTRGGRRGSLGLGRAALMLALLWSPSGRATGTPPATALGSDAPLTKIVFGTDRDYPPFEFFDAGGEPAGFNIELIKALGEELGCAVEIRLDEWPRIRRGLETDHTIDVADMFRAPTRTVALDFSDPFTVVYFEIFLRRDSPPINSLEDLRGRTVIVQDAAIVQEHLLRLDAGAKVITAASEPEALQWLAAGKYDCAIVGQLAGRYAIRQHRLHNLVSSGVPVLPVEYCFAVAAGRDDLRLRLNRGLSALRASGRYDRLHQKWFGDLLRQGMTFRDVLHYAAWVLGPLAGLAIAATAWSLVLRRTVARRTDELRTELAARTRAEKQLHDQYSLLRAVTEGTTDAVFVKDRLGRYQMINSAGAQFLGKPPEAILGRDDTELFSADTAGAIMAADRRVFTSGEVHTDEERGTAAGITRTYLVTKAPWRDDKGALLGLIGVSRDVTDRKQAEAAIRQLNAELEQRVTERTAELAHRVAEVEQLNAYLRASQQTTDRIAAKLQEANASLHLANHELEAFSYSVSHDLRAPLRNISGFIELLHKRTAGAVDAEGERFFGIIASESVRLGNLIDSLLGFSRISRVELKTGPVALADLVEDVRRQMGPELADRAIEWRLAPLPTVRGDRALLHQVVANLLANAVKFTRQRTPALIEIGTEPPDPATPGMATFFVRDNGAGFNPEYSDKLFGVFQRLHNTSEFEGTGIGLANVKRIVVRHGGSVHAVGLPGVGATFSITLPTGRNETAT